MQLDAMLYIYVLYYYIHSHLYRHHPEITLGRKGGGHQLCDTLSRVENRVISLSPCPHSTLCPLEIHKRSCFRG